jgi:SAM-dependent methyltransferase
MTEEEAQIFATRRAVSHVFIQGAGIEIGAGARPWPMHDRAKCFYGDRLDMKGLTDYFKTSDVSLDGRIDAQTLDGVADSSLDFILSAHVIEHLQDPIGSIMQSMRVLKTGGVAVLAVPEMKVTFDQLRSPTPLAHLLQDAKDGGASTRTLAYEEHARFVHPYITGDTIPEHEIAERVAQVEAANMDIHFHAWTGISFYQMLESIQSNTFTIEAYIPIINESIFVLRKKPRWSFPFWR